METVVKLWLADYLLSSPLLLLLLSFVPVPAVCFLLPADFEMTKETTMKMSVYCGYRLLSLFFVFAGIKRWQGQSILVCVYAALFLPCSACYFFLYFCAPLYFFLCFPSPCVFVLLSVPCIREDGDVNVVPLGFFIAFVSVSLCFSPLCYSSSTPRFLACSSLSVFWVFPLGFT
ncbi:hypothetical protein BDE02_02G188600 [Populus trichocarpa]|nr:hypothetical protein BDE02_02G188600 [Populus trichocarpa]